MESAIISKGFWLTHMLVGQPNHHIVTDCFTHVSGPIYPPPTQGSLIHLNYFICCLTPGASSVIAASSGSTLTAPEAFSPPEVVPRTVLTPDHSVKTHDDLSVSPPDAKVGNFLQHKHLALHDQECTFSDQHVLAWVEGMSNLLEIIAKYLGYMPIFGPEYNTIDHFHASSGPVNTYSNSPHVIADQIRQIISMGCLSDNHFYFSLVRTINEYIVHSIFYQGGKRT